MLGARRTNLGSFQLQKIRKRENRANVVKLLLVHYISPIDLQSRLDIYAVISKN